MESYRELLRDFEKSKYGNLYRLESANELECYEGNLEQDLTDEDFDICVDYIYRWYVETACRACEVAQCLVDFLNDGHTIKDLGTQEYYDFMNDAVCRF